LIRRVLFVNNGWRELKETPSSKLEYSVPSSHALRERKETTRVNFLTKGEATPQR
ncbi:hypothetical protein T01_9840, partial [Trichinella spiralis]